MKLLALLAGFAASASVFAQSKPAAEAANSLGLRPGGGYVQAAPPTIGIMPILQLIVALAIVTALLRFVLPKVAVRLNESKLKKHGQIVKIEETTPVNGGMLMLVKARGRTLLIGATAGQMTTLADLTEIPAEPQPKFERMLEEEEEIAEPEVVSESKAPVGPAEALDRLTRFYPTDEAILR